MKHRNNSNRHKHGDVQETGGGTNKLKTLLQKEVETKPWKIPNHGCVYYRALEDEVHCNTVHLHL